jgi:hypothetical protein
MKAAAAAVLFCSLNCLIMALPGGSCLLDMLHGRLLQMNVPISACCAAGWRSWGAIMVPCQPMTGELQADVDQTLHSQPDGSGTT